MKLPRADLSPVIIMALLGMLIFAAGVCLAMMIQANVEFARRNPGGSDFLVAWEGARSVCRGESPYSPETAARIQQRFYGRPALPGENELRVPYPIYSLLLLAPLCRTEDYSAARGIWMTVLELATAAFALAAVRLTGKPWAKWQIAGWLLFSLFWYFGLRAIVNGNVVVLVAVFLAVALLCLQRKWDWASGAALACATFKPQIAVFPIACCLLWLLFTRRFRPVFWFLGFLLLFAGIGWALSPTWIGDEWKEILRYAAYDAPGNPESSLRPLFGAAGSVAGIAISFAALAGIGFLWFRLRKADDGRFLEIMLLTLILAPLSGMQTDPGNQYILLLPIAGIMIRSESPAAGSWIRFLLLSAFLGFGLWALFVLTLQRGDQPMQNPAMLFPLPLFLLGIWGWDRYRAHRPRQTPA